MNLTKIKAIANWSNAEATIINTELNQLFRHILTFDIYRMTDWAIPWCRSATEYPGHHLELTFMNMRYNIWQEDYVRFTIGNVGYLPPSGPNPSRLLAAGRDGGAYNGNAGDTEAVLVLDERAWVILYRVGY